VDISVAVVVVDDDDMTRKRSGTATFHCRLPTFYYEFVDDQLNY
jgi:hypothetical protein